ncbi:unnamed protein product [Prorocentrum cordatum]|uniref:Uncharacterized protein n=1 Tax=Prorocentrum cordatum TaxID=2364126 RepID=A0ABN9WG40_9DINO|nr:unnamed protein product [Polarella glacialis]
MRASAAPGEPAPAAPGVGAQAGHASWAAGCAESGSGGTPQSHVTPNSLLSSAVGADVDEAHTLNSSASFSSFVDSLKVLMKMRLRTESEVQQFLKVHGFSDVNQLRQASRWGAPPACRPLHLAVSVGDAAMVKRLLLHGADPTLPDANGRLPCHTCRARKHAQSGRKEWEAARRAAEAAAAHVFERREGCQRRRLRAVSEARQPPTRGAAEAAASGWDRLFDELRQDPLLDAPRRSRQAVASAGRPMPA